MGCFEVTLNANITYRVGFSLKGLPKPPMGYFEVTLHMGIALKVKSSFKGIQTIYMGYFEATMHVGIAFRVYFSFKLVIHTCIYLYPLEFWGSIAKPVLVLTFTNYNLGA